MLELNPVERRSGLTRETFAREYLEPRIPVAFTDLTASWAARQKWTIEHFKANYGHLQVPVVSNNYSKPGKGYMTPDRVISFREYLEIIESGPTDLRIFLWNIFREAPELRKDFSIPDIMDGFVDELPFMFFGGEGSKVALHYDIDMSHVFLNQIHGRKRVILFSPDQSRQLYHHPYTVASYVDLNRPDYQKYPALSFAKGYEVMLQPGETLFMPSGYWHYIEYTDGGYSISLRSFGSLPARVRGLANIARHFVVDKGMNRLIGPGWRRMKERMAERRAEEVLQEEE
ncbi:MAG TPA: cupin-like domain-containing protein [Saprospiraceae bacterium]|nr:cupin-like domain-containing protein [Saprospiraceae bacterium]HND89540.1 cupin-like domain-containing protein [Saprospiraceae bacterium]HNG90058.1 cupin-like domain-containing protein [Saprospiraceae bacterium]